MFYRFTRKSLFAIPLALLIITLVFFSTFQPKASAATTLGSAAAAKGRTFAAAVANSHLTGDAQFVSTLDTEFTGLTPENEMKWDTTEPSRGSFNFSAADAIVSHAQSHNMKIRGHTLVWHNQLPGWVTNITSGSDLLTAMKNHITTEMTHFKGKITYWDVVNEAYDGSVRRSDVFQNEIGNAYIEDAFIAARAADPNAKLCYNDYSTDGVNAKSTAILNMVKDFKARGIPIDCVGFQAHLIVGQVPSDFQANLQRFSDAGVDVNITELDIRMPTPASTANLQQQATDYSRVVASCLAVARCTSITTWGITDKYSWVPGTFPGQGSALLFDDNYNKKPAYNSVIQALGGASTPPPTTTPPTATPTPRPGMTPTPTSTPPPGVTPTPTPPPTSGGVHVAYQVTSQWTGGFTSSVTITNSGSSAINGWTLKFSFPGSQQVTTLWNGQVTQSGNQVTVTNASYNGAIAPGASVNIGFNGSWSGSNPNPTSFTLNGAATN